MTFVTTTKNLNNQPSKPLKDFKLYRTSTEYYCLINDKYHLIDCINIVFGVVYFLIGKDVYHVGTYLDNVLYKYNGDTLYISF